MNDTTFPSAVLPTGSGTSRRIRMDTLAVKSTASIDVTSPMSAPYSRTFAFDGDGFGVEDVGNRFAPGHAAGDAACQANFRRLDRHPLESVVQI